MDAETGPALDDDAGDAEQPQYLVRISDPGEIAASLAFLLGFQPQESVVLVALGGASGGRLGLTVRADLPPSPRYAGAVARVVAEGIATDEPAGVLVVIVSEADDEEMPDLDGDGPVVDLPHRFVLHDVVLALAARDIPVRDSLLVRNGRWWSYECPDPCCAPDAGTPLPSAVSELAAASVAIGQVVEPSRARLVERIAPVTGQAADHMAEVSLHVGIAFARETLDDEARAKQRSWSAIRQAVDRCRPGQRSARVRLSAREVARVVWGLTDLRVRDRALGLALGQRAAAAEILWTECTRRAPESLQAAPATLLAVSAWLRGDGAMANVALEHALTCYPGYALAQLLAQGLANCVRPSEIRATVRETVAELDRSGL